MSEQQQPITATTVDLTPTPEACQMMKQMFQENLERSQEKLEILSILEKLLEEYASNFLFSPLLHQVDIATGLSISRRKRSEQERLLLFYEEIISEVVSRGIRSLTSEEEERIDSMQVGINELERCGY